MTNELSVEEAVELLKEQRMEIHYQVNGTTRFSKALDMAIKVLEQQPYRKSEKVVTELKLDKKFIDEAVQEAVKDIKQNYIPKDVLDKIRDEDCISRQTMLEVVKQLPSVTPQPYK